MVELACRAEASGTILWVEQAEQVGPQKDFPDSGWLALQPDDFPAEGPPDEPLAALPKEPAIGTDAALAPRGGISPVRQAFGQGPRADAIKPGGWPQAQRLVWPDLIVVGPPTVGAPLVRAGMRGGMVGDFGLIDAVHLFVRRVVLRVRGPTKLDAEAPPPPPDREARKPAGADPANRRPIVHADDFGQAVTTKHAGQRAPGGGVAWVGQEPAVQEETACEITDAQGFDAGAVAGAKPAFEIQGPDVVGRAGQRAGHGQMNARMELPQPGAQFTGSPGWMAEAQLTQGRWPAPRQLPWRTVRAAGMIAQTGPPVAAKPLHPLVTRRADDVETATELHKGFAPCQSRKGKPFTNGNQRASKPGHARSVRPTPTSEWPRCPVPRCPQCPVPVPDARTTFNSTAWFRLPEGVLKVCATGSNGGGYAAPSGCPQRRSELEFRHEFDFASGRHQPAARTVESLRFR